MPSLEYAIPFQFETLPDFSNIGFCNPSVGYPDFFPRSPEDELLVTVEYRTPIETIDPKLLCSCNELSLPVSTTNSSPSEKSYKIELTMGNATSSPTSGITPDTPGLSADDSGYSSMSPDTPSDSDISNTPRSLEEYDDEPNGGRPAYRPGKLLITLHTTYMNTDGSTFTDPLAMMHNASNCANHPSETARTPSQDPFFPQPVFHAHAGPPLYIRIDGGYMIVVPSGRTWFIPESALSTGSVKLGDFPYPTQFSPPINPTSPNSSVSRQAQASANNNTRSQGAPSPEDAYPTPESLSPRRRNGPQQFYFVEPETIQTIGELYEREQWGSGDDQTVKLRRHG